MQFPFFLLPLEHSSAYAVTVILPPFFFRHAESLSVGRIMFILRYGLFSGQGLGLHLAAFWTCRNDANFSSSALMLDIRLALTLAAKNLLTSVFCAILVERTPGIALRANEKNSTWSPPSRSCKSFSSETMSESK